MLPANHEKRILVGAIAVDAGVIAVGDPGSFVGFPDGDWPAPGEPVSLMDGEVAPFTMAGISKLLSSGKPYGVLKNAIGVSLCVVADTVDGDGFYDIFVVLNANGTPIRLEVDLKLPRLTW